MKTYGVAPSHTSPYGQAATVYTYIMLKNNKAFVNIKMHKYWTFCVLISCHVLCKHTEVLSWNLFIFYLKYLQPLVVILLWFFLMIFLNKPWQDSSVHECIAYYIQMSARGIYSVFDCCLIDFKHCLFFADEKCVLRSYSSTSTH